MSTRLVEFVRTLVEESGKTPTEIAKELNVQESWVRHFLKGHIRSPQADKMQDLYEYFTGEELLPKRTGEREKVEPAGRQ